MATQAKKRKISPCKDREETYEMMSGWTFREVEKVYSNIYAPALSYPPEISIETLTSTYISILLDGFRFQNRAKIF